MVVLLKGLTLIALHCARCYINVEDTVSISKIFASAMHEAEMLMGAHTEYKELQLRLGNRSSMSPPEPGSGSISVLLYLKQTTLFCRPSSHVCLFSGTYDLPVCKFRIW